MGPHRKLNWAFKCTSLSFGNLTLLTAIIYIKLIDFSNLFFVYISMIALQQRRHVDYHRSNTSAWWRSCMDSSTTILWSRHDILTCTAETNSEDTPGVKTSWRIIDIVLFCFDVRNVDHALGPQIMSHARYLMRVYGIFPVTHIAPRISHLRLVFY